MHHEDRAGVNAFIRGIDRLASGDLPAAVLMCTNRLNALDPAVRRRAADILVFDRPDEVQRLELLHRRLGDAGFSKADLQALVAATGEQVKRPYGFTYSDLTQRLLPAIVLDAYPSGAHQAVSCDRTGPRDGADSAVQRLHRKGVLNASVVALPASFVFA